MSASKLLTWRYRGPARATQNLRELAALHHRTRVRHRNTLFLMRRGHAAGDPSWLSSFISHNKKIIDSALGSVPVVGGVLSAGFDAFAPRDPSNPAFLPAGAGPARKVNGPTAGMAPPNLFPLKLGNYQTSLTDPGSDPTNTDPLGVFGSDDGSGAAAGPGTIVSSGGGSMLYHHFMGNSHSRAIPVNQTNGIKPRGYHVNRHGYYLASIATWVPAGTVYVPNRRRNPLNPRAMHRAMSRLISGKHAVRKLGLLDVPRHKRSSRRRFAGIPRRRQLKAG